MRLSFFLLNCTNNKSWHKKDSDMKQSIYSFPPLTFSRVKSCSK